MSGVAEVYVIATSDGLTKIGTSKRPARRLSVIRCVKAASAELVYSTGPIEDPGQIERLAQSALRDHRVSGEWFLVDSKSAVASIRRALAMRRNKKRPTPYRGGVPVGRKIVFQSAFDDGDCDAIKALAAETSRSISATLRDLALAGLALQKGKRK
jgi:hypothetical protein